MPQAHAASGHPSERTAQARTLPDTPQGETLLDFLGDPAVRERMMRRRFWLHTNRMFFTRCHQPAPHRHNYDAPASGAAFGHRQ
jgi:hypothetical protein